MVRCCDDMQQVCYMWPVFASGRTAIVSIALINLMTATAVLPAADLVALPAGPVLLASTALVATTPHAGAAVLTSPAHLNHLVWISVCVQLDMV